MNVFVILFVVVTAFLLLLKLFASLTGRISERLLTSHFRALEDLLEHKKLPPDWHTQVQKIADDQSSSEEQAKLFLLEKIGNLQNYFESSPFVDSPEARTLLHEQLDAIATQWNNAELSEILSTYDKNDYS